MDGRDLLALMPTGSGKSLTYQLAAMLRPTPTLVLSPLIALMKDQVDKLPPQIAEVATFVNSSLEASEAAERITAVREGRARLLYAAPERLRQRSFVELLKSVGVGLVVIDEVHCVSMWGHDFRPDYLFIRRALELLGSPSVLGMTATATPRTAAEIATALGRTPDVVRTSVVRPNLRYDVEQVANQNERLELLIERLHELRGESAIVYARSRRSCEEIARTLKSHGLHLEHYHAGLDASERVRVQDDFVHGRIQGVVATTAFGMGIDKPDVRLVCLVNLPDSLESYVQMVGRAGRDGEPSDTLLLASPADATALRRFATESVPSAAALRSVFRALKAHEGSATPDALADAVGDEHDPRVLVGMLEQAGLVTRGFDAGRALSVEFPPPPPDAATAVDDLLTRYRTEAVARSERMIAFAGSRECRHAEVARHFGEEPPAGSCNACDVCARRGSSRKALRITATLPDGYRCCHHRRRRQADLAARAAKSRGDASRLGVGAEIGPALRRLRHALRRVGVGGQALGRRARTGGSARANRDRRRLHRPPRRPSCRGPRSRPVTRTSLDQARDARSAGQAIRPSSVSAPGVRSAPRPTACRRTWCSTTRRCASLRPTRPTSAKRAGGREGARSGQGRALRRGDPRRPRLRVEGRPRRGRARRGPRSGGSERPLVLLRGATSRPA